MTHEEDFFYIKQYLYILLLQNLVMAWECCVCSSISPSIPSLSSIILYPLARGRGWEERISYPIESGLRQTQPKSLKKFKHFAIRCVSREKGQVAGVHCLYLLMLKNCVAYLVRLVVVTFRKWEMIKHGVISLNNGSLGEVRRSGIFLESYITGNLNIWGTS